MAFPGRYLMLLAVAAALPARAEPPAGPPPLTVRLMSWQGELPDLALEAEPTPVVVTVHEFAWTSELAVKAGTPLRLWRKADLVAGAAPNAAPLVEVEVPPQVKRALVVLAPAPAGAAFPLIGRVWDNSLEAHPVDTVRLLNLASKPVVLAIDTRRMEVAPGRDRVLPYPGDKPAAFVRLAVNEGDRWKLIKSGLRPVNHGTRILYVVRDGRPVPARLIDASIRPAAPAAVEVFVYTDSKPQGPDVPKG